ncbi:MAG: hypothetical protein KA247_00770 [Bacteroidetes bacterium]|nr:hypothetical protein [Bacteroidota bacterium]
MNIMHALTSYGLIGIVRSAVVLMFLCVSVSAQSMDIKGGNVTMTVSTGIAGSQPVSAVNSSTTLTYKKQNQISKITVKTVCLAQAFTLDVEATNVTGGNAAPAVLLVNGNAAMDLIRNIPKNGSTTFTCRLQYTASATFEQGNSSEVTNDTHTVTYTIQLQ